MTLDNLRTALILNNKMLLDRLKGFLHKHDNLETLNGLATNDTENLTFKGNLVNEQYEVSDADILQIVNEVMNELDKTLGNNGSDNGNTGGEDEDNNNPGNDKDDNSSNPPVPEPTPLTITVQPQDTAIEHGQSGTVTIEATGDGLTYQWYGLDTSDNGVALGETPTYSGSTTNTLSVTVHDNFVELYGESGKSLYCVITDSHGNTIISNTIIVTVIENED